jgi:DNA modification methylase
MDPTPPAVRLHLGDCLAVMKSMETGSVDAVITDQTSKSIPFHSTNIWQEWQSDTRFSR